LRGSGAGLFTTLRITMPRRAAITFVELVVVFAIIGVSVALLLTDNVIPFTIERHQN
jgi:hypothetical protein